MNKEIFIVYVTYINCIELMYAFETKENAEAKCFELNRKWVNEKSFNQYIKDNKVTQINLDTYNDYYLEVEDDSYVGINKIVLEAEPVNYTTIPNLGSLFTLECGTRILKGTDGRLLQLVNNSDM